jgi:hypothetical protein
LGGGGNDAVKSTNINEIQIISAGYQKPAKTVENLQLKNVRRFFKPKKNVVLREGFSGG